MNDLWTDFLDVAREVDQEYSREAARVLAYLPTIDVPYRITHDGIAFDFPEGALTEKRRLTLQRLYAWLYAQMDGQPNSGLMASCKQARDRGAEWKEIGWIAHLEFPEWDAWEAFVDRAFGKFGGFDFLEMLYERVYCRRGGPRDSVQDHPTGGPVRDLGEVEGWEEWMPPLTGSSDRGGSDPAHHGETAGVQ